MQTLDLTNTVAAITDPDIDKFGKLVQPGIDAWNEAGKLLVLLMRQDSNIIPRIQAKFPDMSRDMIQVFERIGRKQIYAPLLADTSAAARKLLELPYQMQERYHKELI